MLSKLKIFVAMLLIANAAPVLAVDVQHWKQANGAEVYFIATHTNPIVDVRVSFDAGNQRDKASALGVADMTANLLDAGTSKLSEEGINDQEADLAIQLNTFSSTESAGIVLRSLAQEQTLNPSLQLASEILSQPSFPVGVLAREKNREIEGLKQAESKPGFLAMRELVRLMYAHHPYANGAWENNKSIKSLRRDQLVAFWQQHYQPRYAVVAVVGDLTREQADKVAQKLLSGLKNGKSTALPEIPPVPEAKAQYRHLDNPASQAHIELGMPVITRDDPDYYSLVVGNYVLGAGGFDSRLMQEIRVKRGLTYGVSSSLAPMQRAGVFEIGLSTRKDQSAAALKLVRETLAKYLKDGPSKAELAQAKSNIIGGFPLRFDSNAKLLMYLSLIGQYKLPIDYMKRYPLEVKKITPAMVREVWQRRIKPEDISTVVVGGADVK